MSKLTRHAAIRKLVDESEIASQDELRRKLFRLGHRVTQATLSRDLHELGLLKRPRDTSCRRERKLKSRFPPSSA